MNKSEFLVNTNSFYTNFTKMFKFLNQCFAQLWFWKSVSDSRNLLDGATAVLLETLFQNWSRAKHWFKNLNILDKLLIWLSLTFKQNFQKELISDLMSKIIRIFLIYFSSNNFSFNEFLSKIYSQMTLVFKTPLLRNMVNSLDDTRQGA